MPVHYLKIYPEYFEAVISGQKTVELRREDDRQFAVGDVLVLREWDPFPQDEASCQARQRWYEDEEKAWAAYRHDERLRATALVHAHERAERAAAFGRYTGRECRVRVTHILRDEQWLQPGVAALSIRVMEGEGTHE